MSLTREQRDRMRLRADGHGIVRWYEPEEGIALLDALDAAEARIAELEAEVVSWAIKAGERRKQEARP